MSRASLNTIDKDVLAAKTGNIYKSVYVVSERAKKIAVTTKEELTSKLAEFASTVDNLEEIFENREQIEISKFYERQPKPSKVALNEFLDDELVVKEMEEDNSNLPLFS